MYLIIVNFVTSNQAITRVCGITHSVSARRWEGYGFDARPKTASYLKNLKVVPTAAISDAQH